MGLLQLPPEMLLHVGNNLGYVDHSHWAQTCRMLWALSQQRTKNDKMHCLYGEAWAVEDSMLHFLSQFMQEPSLSLYVEKLVLSTFKDDAVRLIKPSDNGNKEKFYHHNCRNPPPPSEEALEYLIRMFPEALEESNQLGTLEPFKIHMLPLLPNLISMEFIVDYEDRCISTLLQQPEFLKTQCLQNLEELTLFWCGAQDGLPFSTVQLFISLPKLQSLTAWDVVHDLEDESVSMNCNTELSNIKHISFRGNNIVDSNMWTTFLCTLQGLHSFKFHAQTEVMEDYDSQDLLRLLLQRHSNSLKRLCLSTNRESAGYAQDSSTYATLQAFVELKELECEWRDIVAGGTHDLVSSMLPPSLQVLKLKKCEAEETIVLRKLLLDHGSTIRQIEIDCRDVHQIAGIGQKFDITVKSSASD